MKIWTIQSQTTVDRIVKKGIHQPIFSRSKYYHQNREVYDFLLKSFNTVNNSTNAGVIFGMAKANMNNPIKDFVDFTELLIRFHDVIYTFHSINKPNYKVLELQYDDNFNPLAIDYNDWQIIMPPYDYFTDKIPEIHNCLANGIYHSPVISSITQLHAPYIKNENIINIYDNVSF